MTKLYDKTGKLEEDKEEYLKVQLKDQLMNVTRLTDRTFLGRFRVKEVYDSTLKVTREDTGSRQTYYLPNPCCTLSFTHVVQGKIKVGQKGETSYMYEYELLGELE